MKLIQNVPYIDQTPKYPTGCESISAVMLLSAIGFPISPEEFIDRHLPKEELRVEDGVLTGPDPNEKFVGSPYGSGTSAYGCFAGPISTALRRILPEIWEVRDLTGVPTETLLAEYIDRDLPVVYWSTLNLLPPQEGPSWRIRGSQKTWTWKNNEHCMLLVGYDDRSLYFLDPWEGHGLISCTRRLGILRHTQQGSAAVGVRRAPDDPGKYLS